jgi:hypothetical protein
MHSSLDTFKLFYVNKFADHHAFANLAWESGFLSALLSSVDLHCMYFSGHFLSTYASLCFCVTY